MMNMSSNLVINDNSWSGLILQFKQEQITQIDFD